MLNQENPSGANSSECSSGQDSADASLMSSILSAGSLDELSTLDPAEIWQGDVEQDWERCRTIMKRLGRDGRKLELWRRWLGVDVASLVLGKGKEKQWTEDNEPLPSEITAMERQVANTLTILPSTKHISSVVNLHGQTLFASFIFPDSRAQFVEVLGKAGIVPEFNGKGEPILDSGLNSPKDQDEIFASEN
jgi:hypothetical protein